MVQIGASGLFALVFFLAFSLYFCFFFLLLTPLVKNSLAVMSIWWNDILNFQGLYIKWITLPSSSPNTFSTCWAQTSQRFDHQKPPPPACTTHTNMHTLSNSLWAVVVASWKNNLKAFVLFNHYTLSNSAYSQEHIGCFSFHTAAPFSMHY